LLSNLNSDNMTNGQPATTGQSTPPSATPKPVDE
jgi:hypothetical protein